MGIVSLTTYTNYNSLGNDINVVGTFSGGDITKFTDKHVSSPVINYVESYEYKGTQKTLFYTEVNTGLKVGDRVYIVNGNYDSARRIRIDKYKKGSDGYLVLYVDRCQIVLDIDYTGNRPNNGDVEVGDLMSDYTKVYYLDSYDSFVSANRQLTTRGGYMGGKFDYYQNNVAFIDTNFPAIQDGWTSTTGVTASPGFYVREPAYDTNLLGNTTGKAWTNITTPLMSGSFSYALPEKNPKNEYRYYSNGKIIVMGNGFTHNGVEYAAGTVYEWNETEQRWLPDVNEKGMSSPALITKANFRQGNFSGTFYSGIYGNKNRMIKWTGDGTWFGGTLFNTSWVSGSMFSRILLEESYKTYLDRSRMPKQKLNTYNNGGYGFNFIIDSEFESTSIYSAIVRNTKFGMTPSTPVVERYLTGESQTFEHVLNNGLFESCYFNNTMLIGSTMKNSRSSNTMMDGVKHINSWTRNSVIKNSTLIADSLIKIDGYDEWSASEKRGSLAYGAAFSDELDFKVYKFYIGEADFLKLKHGDSFYIRGMRVVNDPDLLNIFDRRFTVGTWTEYVDDFNSTGQQINDVMPNTFYKKGISCAAFLVSIEENEWIYNSVKFENPTNGGTNTMGYMTDTLTENPNPRYSIDIFVSVKGNDRLPVDGINFNFSTQSTSSLNYIRPQIVSNRIDISEAYVVDSDIESGIVDNCSWNSGNNINYNNDLVIANLIDQKGISTYKLDVDRDTGNMTVTTLGSTLRPEIADRRSKGVENDIRTGDILFINGLDHYSKGKVLGIAISGPGSLYVDSTAPVGLSYSGASASKDGYGLTVNYTTTNGTVTDVTIVNKGLDYKAGDVLYLRVDQQGSLGTGVDAKITITSVDETPTTRLPDAWKLLQYNPPVAVLNPLYDADVVKGLTDSGVFMTMDANNRWMSFNRTKITNSRIKSGTFRRSALSSNLIENLDYDATDRDFTNRTKIKSLVMSDIIFNNTGNQLSLATYHNSSLFGGTDTWLNGIIYRSVLNKMTFNKGIVKESSWIDGTFNGGLFYQSNSYDAKPLPGLELFNIDRVRSNHKGGSSAGGYNDRYSWRSGTFNGGEFLKSDWEGGVFNGGEFYGSKWYGGTARGGVFGKDFTATEETAFYNGTVDYTTVANASFIADDSSKTGVTNSIVWNGGVFNGGVFGSRRTNLTANQRNVKTYNLGKGNYTLNVVESIQIDVPDTLTDINEILLKLDISAPGSDLSNVAITLFSPANESIFIKSYLTAAGDRMSTTFTSDATMLELTKGTYPFTGTFRFANPPNASYKTNVADLIGTGGTLGQWTIFLTNKTSATINLNLSASLSLVSDKKSTNYIESSATWNNGTFNGGQFVSYARWMNGDFNGGKFISTKGWEISGSYSTEGPSSSHSWVTGRFNGGEFGNSTTGENSTWGNGEFNNGIFGGRVWNGGIFKNGLFLGSGATASGGWVINTVATVSYASNFVESFSQSFYGLWRDGLVTASDDEKLTYDGYWNTLAPKQYTVENKKTVSMKNVLWMNGRFDHINGTLSDSVWMSGTFSRGTFESGTFNPFVKRIGGVSPAFSDGAVWAGGKFTSGDFFYSEWHSGEFITGTGFGMWFQDGVAYYMNAYNVTWGSTASYPRWKNGNWEGSGFDYMGAITNPLQKAVIDKSLERNGKIGLTELQGTNLHVWNIFQDKSSVDLLGIAQRADIIETLFEEFTPGSETTVGGQIMGEWKPPVVW